jgi:hypothetical protein
MLQDTGIFLRLRSTHFSPFFHIKGANKIELINLLPTTVLDPRLWNKTKFPPDGGP